MHGISTEKFAFVELAKVYLGYTHIPGQVSGFNPSSDDEVVCLDMVLSFPEVLISEWNCGGIPRHLAHGVVSFFVQGRALTYSPDGIAMAPSPLVASGIPEFPPLHERIMQHITTWKEKFGK